jgi:hypothetical protein
MWFALDTILLGTYKVNVLGVLFGSVYTGHQMMEAVGLG